MTAIVARRLPSDLHSTLAKDILRCVTLTSAPAEAAGAGSRTTNRII
jgi:hypothetical protein